MCLVLAMGTLGCSDSAPQVCDDGYAGADCSECAPGFHDEGGACMLDFQCLPSTCSGTTAGTCSDATGTISCTCNSGYMGSFCEECDAGFHRDATGACAADESCATSDPCVQGTCSDTGGTITCDCEDGWQGANSDSCAPGFHDEAGACVADFQCLPSTCSGTNAGTCDDSGGTIACTCSAGYSGSYCETCDTGFHRDATGACVIDESCATSNPCVQGTCDDTGGVISCSCSAGYTGTTCDGCAPGFHDDGGSCVADFQCLPSTCSGLTAGTCSDAGGVISCGCNTGYTGTYCESCNNGYHRDASGSCVVDESCAANDPCVQGTCNDAGGTISCECSYGWSGTTCNTCAPGFHDDGGSCLLDQQCLPGSCSGVGQCDDGGGVVTCSCDTGFAGFYCETCDTGYVGNFCQDCDTGYARDVAGECAVDTDGDNTPDSEDECPQNPDLINFDVCGGCETNPADSDGDGLADCIDPDVTLTVTSAFNSGNQGNMFDIEPQQDMKLKRLRFTFNGCASSAHSANVYFKAGTHVGFESNSAAWTYVNGGTVSCSGWPFTSSIDLGDLDVTGGNVYAIYVVGVNRGLVANWTGSIGQLFADDGALRVYLGRAHFGTWQPYSASASALPTSEIIYNTY